MTSKKSSKSIQMSIRLTGSNYEYLQDVRSRLEEIGLDTSESQTVNLIISQHQMFVKDRVLLPETDQVLNELLQRVEKLENQLNELS